jgi:HD-GYP domain-containing protein (c-di-GMP phosphodiesterase class II)
VLLDYLPTVSGVTTMTAGLAAQFALDAEALDETLRAAELHDIGKLAIPDAILNKPGPLDANEWAFMKQHPIIGQRILNAAAALTPVAALVRSSHERWDGAGYPDGLSGEAIPLGAPIIAVCDAYDAMTSERCYQNARSHQDALAELRNHAGTQFDPAVVEALERHFDAVGESSEADLKLDDRHFSSNWRREGPTCHGPFLNARGTFLRSSRGSAKPQTRQPEQDRHERREQHGRLCSC